MKLTALRLAASLLLVAPAGAALAQSAIAVGTPVVDSTGASVGTVAAIKGDNLLVRTDKHEALLPSASFTSAQGKLLFGMSRAQLNAEIEKNQASAQAAVAPGASVRGLAGEMVGTIVSLEADAALIKLQSGTSVSVPRSGLRGNADGSVVIGISADELEAQVKATANGA